jgi:hypothetical protein
MHKKKKQKKARNKEKNMKKMKKKEKNKRQPNPLTCGSHFLTNWTYAFTHTHCTLQKNVNLMRRRVQFAPVCFKSVPEILDPGPSSKVALRSRAAKCTQCCNTHLNIVNLLVQ